MVLEMLALCRRTLSLRVFIFVHKDNNEAGNGKWEAKAVTIESTSEL
jgi:adenine specific DNA methylase Mod